MDWRRAETLIYKRRKEIIRWFKVEVGKDLGKR